MAYGLNLACGPEGLWQCLAMPQCVVGGFADMGLHLCLGSREKQWCGSGQVLVLTQLGPKEGHSSLPWQKGFHLENTLGEHSFINASGQIVWPSLYCILYWASQTLHP